MSDIARADTLGWDRDITRSNRTVLVTHAGIATLLDLDGGLRITLDPFGHRVWTLLATASTLRTLLDALSDDDPAREPLVDDVRRLLARWREQRLVAW